MPSGSPWASKVSCLLGLPNPMWVRATMSEGRPSSARAAVRRRVHLGHVHPVHLLDLPAKGGEAGAHVLREGDVGGGGQGDLVGIVEDDEPAEAEIAGQRGGLRRDAFHQIAIARDDPGAVVDRLPWPGRLKVAASHRSAMASPTALANP